MKALNSETSLIWSQIGYNPVSWFLICLLAVLWKRKRHMSVLQRNGVPSLVPNLMFGNLTEAMALPNVIFDSQLINRLGINAGYYLGAKPVLLTCDPTLIERIQKVPRVSKLFRNRPRRIPGGINPDKKRALMLGNLPEREWHDMRKKISQGFNGSALKRMASVIHEKTSTMMTILKANESQKAIEFHRTFQLLVLDIIGQLTFGVASNMQIETDDRLHSAVKAEFSKSISGLCTTAYLCCPELTPIMSRIRSFIHRFKKQESPLWTLGYRALKTLRDSDYKKDPSQTLMNHLLQTDSGLSDDQIVANTVLMFEAAYETTSSCLAFMVHFLARNSRVQKKIRKEIRKQRRHFPADSFEIDFLRSLKYLHACILECLRIYPPQTTFINRSSSESLRHGNMTIPENVNVQVALVQLHRNPQLWHKPMYFNPKRFLQDKVALEHDCIYQSFGQGPRACIGKQLAMVILKIALVSILETYKIQDCDKTEPKGKVSIEYKTATMSPAKGSYARLVRI